MSRIYIGGTFDLFHAGHVNLFRQAKGIADTVIVALNTDEFNERYKGHLPVMNLDERRVVVAACRYVDVVDVNEGGADSRPAILRTRPDFILHGDDWTGEALMKQMSLTEEFLKEHGIQMKYVAYSQGISTTELKRRIRERLL